LVDFGLAGGLVAFLVAFWGAGLENAVTAPKVKAIPIISGMSFFIFAVLLWFLTNDVVLAFMISNRT
jgi:hypothetical protein